jgi:hypothetical protein
MLLYYPVLYHDYPERILFVLRLSAGRKPGAQRSDSERKAGNVFRSREYARFTAKPPHVVLLWPRLCFLNIQRKPELVSIVLSGRKIVPAKDGGGRPGWVED